MNTTTLNTASEGAILTDQIQSEVKTLKNACVVVLIASLFFFYEFIQMNMLDALSLPLMKVFSINAEQLGKISSYYFLANVIFLIPAGILFDRYSTRKIILLSLALCIVGTALFAFAPSVFWAKVFRFMTGIGSGFCFLSADFVCGSSAFGYADFLDKGLNVLGRSCGQSGND